jgi:hypothetical protein
MVALLEPAPWEHVWPLLAVLVVGATWWVLAHRRSQARLLTAIELTVLILVMLLVAGHYLLPATARAHREYYQGKDQFQWVEQLTSGDAAAKSEAVAALCEILKSSKTSVRWYIVQELGAAGRDAEAARPILVKILYVEDDPVLREYTQYAIEQIDNASLPLEGKR